uniref:Retinoic acid receptor responder 1 n=1 Tax=Leptobrachium leishanense TaxID=445787 RepID=A0A8C5PKU0_9ANUR
MGGPCRAGRITYVAAQTQGDQRTLCIQPLTMQQLLCLLLLLPLAIQALPFAISQDLWQLRELPTSHRSARHPALLAVQYFNYQAGSPSSLLSLHQVIKAKVKSVPEIGKKYYVDFTAKSLKNPEEVSLCSASVFFHLENPRPAIKVDCPANTIQALDDDYNFYKKIKQRSTPLNGQEIPDGHGYVAPDLVPVWNLAELASSYVMWDKSTEDLEYSLQQIKNFKQVMRKDDLIAFDYDVLLHEIPYQEMVFCHIHVVWIPGKLPKVEYHCSHDSDENGSGSKSEEGSSSLGNFK